MMRRRQIAWGWISSAAAAARLPWRVRMASTGEGETRKNPSTESHQGFIGAMGAEWQDINSTKSKGDYQWPMADKIDGMGSSLVNLSKKVRYALRQVRAASNSLLIVYQHRPSLPSPSQPRRIHASSVTSPSFLPSFPPPPPFVLLLLLSFLLSHLLYFFSFLLLPFLFLPPPFSPLFTT